MPEIKIESAGQDLYRIWIHGVKQSGTHTLDQCMSIIAATEEIEQKEKAGE